MVDLSLLSHYGNVLLLCLTFLSIISVCTFVLVYKRLLNLLGTLVKNEYQCF